MKNNLQFLAVKRNLEFSSLRKEYKNFLYENYSIIIRLPKKLPSDLWVDDDFYICCQNMKKTEKQIVFYGILMHLSNKMYFMICALLLLGEIDDFDFQDIHFRPNAIKGNALAEGNLRKSLNDLKKAIKEQVKINCEVSQNYFNNNSKKEFDEDLYNKEFKKLAYSYLEYSNKIKTKYTRSALPEFLQRVCKKNNKK